MTKKWQIYESNNEKIEEISQKYNLNKLLATILVNRKIEENQIEIYLNPNRKNFHDPFLMPDMEIAVNRILKAMKNKEKIRKKEKKYKPTISCIMEKTTGARTGRKPKNDPADRKYSFRLNAEENTRFERLLADSGARDRTLFIKKSIFSGQIKVVRIDKATMDYYIKLTEFHKQFQAIGNNYNQVVRALKNNFGEKRAMSLLYRLEKLSVELMLLCKKITALTQEYERKWLQR